MHIKSIIHHVHRAWKQHQLYLNSIYHIMGANHCCFNYQCLVQNWCQTYYTSQNFEPFLFKYFVSFISISSLWNLSSFLHFLVTLLNLSLYQMLLIYFSYYESIIFLILFAIFLAVQYRSIFYVTFQFIFLMINDFSRLLWSTKAFKPAHEKSILTLICLKNK